MAKLVPIVFRLAVLIGICVAGYYIGRPLYWKVSATLQEIREKEYTHEAVKQGLTDFMRDAKRSVGSWTGAMKMEQDKELRKSQRKKEIAKAEAGKFSKESSSKDGKKPKGSAKDSSIKKKGQSTGNGKSREIRRLLNLSS